MDLEALQGGGRAMVITLPEGYRKCGVIWCGRTPVVACFDSGSYRNMLPGDMFTRLSHEQGAIVSQGRCEPTACDGFVRGSSAVYDHVVILRVTFREEGTKEYSKQLLFVVAPDATMSMILGCPTTELLGATWTKEIVDLTAVNIRFPAVLPLDQH